MTLLALFAQHGELNLSFEQRLLDFCTFRLQLGDMQLFMHEMRLERAQLNLHIAKIALCIFCTTLLNLQKITQTCDFLAVVVGLDRRGTQGGTRHLMVFDDNLTFLNKATTTLVGHYLLVCLLSWSLITSVTEALKCKTKRIFAELCLLIYFLVKKI